jgi:hypothetical protein
MGFAVAAPAIAVAQSALPEIKSQATAQAVLDEHMDALNHCDWNRIVAQYPDDAQINLPGGAVVAGRKAIGEMFAGFCKDSKDGGLKGINFKVEHSTTIGDTFATQWVATADFLAEPERVDASDGDDVRWRGAQDEEVTARPFWRELRGDREETDASPGPMPRRQRCGLLRCRSRATRPSEPRWRRRRRALALLSLGR